MANTHVPNSSPMIARAAGDTDPQMSSRGNLGSGGLRQFASFHALADYRTGENFSQLKLAAEKLMQEEASLRSELNIMKSNLLKSEEEVCNLESILLKTNNEIAMLKVEHNEDVKLWKGLESKFLAASTFSDHLAETLALLESQLKEAERSKTLLVEKLAEREKFYEDTKSQIDDLSLKIKASEDSIKDYETTIAKLNDTIQEQTATLAAEIAKSEKLSCENDGLHQQISKAVRRKEEDKEIIQSKTTEIQLLTKDLLSKTEDVANMQSKNLAIVQAKGELEFHLKDLENSINLQRKDNETLREKIEMLNFKISELQRTNEVATCTIENLHSERARRIEQAEEEKKAEQERVNELTLKLLEHEKYAESTRQTLEEKTQKIETLLKRVEERGAELETTKEEVIRIRQECCEKQQLIEQMLQQEQNLRREIQEVRGHCTAAENVAKELSVRFKHQLDAKQAELTIHLQEISLRNNQEMADMRRRYEEQTREAAAEEKRKGEAALEAIREASKQELLRELDAANQRLNSALMDHEDMVRLIKQASEEEKGKTLALHAKELRDKEQELRAEMEKRCSDVSQALQHRNDELKKCQQEEMTNLQARHDILLQTAQEAHLLKEQMKKLEEDHKMELETIVEELNTKSDLLSREHEAVIKRLESTSIKEVDEWKSKAAFWQIEYIKLRTATTQAALAEKKGADRDIASAPSNTADDVSAKQASPAEADEKKLAESAESSKNTDLTSSRTSPSANRRRVSPPRSCRIDDELIRTVTKETSQNNEDHKQHYDELGKDSQDDDLRSLIRKAVSNSVQEKKVSENDSHVHRELRCEKNETVLAPSSLFETKFDGVSRMDREHTCLKAKKPMNSVTKITSGEFQNGQLQSYPQGVIDLENAEGKSFLRKRLRRTTMVEEFPITRPNSETKGTVVSLKKTHSTVSGQECDKIKISESWLHNSVGKSRKKQKKVKFNENQQPKELSKTLCDLFEMEELMDPYAFNE